MLDVSVAYNRYKFLGHEFLTWLWYIIENDRSKLVNEDGEQISLEIGNRIVIENLNQDETVESITIKGNVGSVFKKVKPKLDEWNKTLNKSFPNLPKA